jgi:hypothetical protein
MSQQHADILMKRSKDAELMLPYWNKVDAIVSGADAIRKAGTDYLPKFVDEENKDYNFRLAMTKFTNVYRDIVESLANKPFESEVSLAEGDEKAKPPEQIKEFIENVDGSGSNLTAFAAATFFNGVNSAIDWMFIDYPKVDNSIVRTIEDAKNAKIRPFWSHVLARNVFEVKVTMTGAEEVLTYARIYEPGSPDHIRIFEKNPDGKVIWTLYEKTDTWNEAEKTYFVKIDEGLITIGVIPLVPFTTGRRDGRTFHFFPLMQDAADLQIELYQQESALKFAKTLTAYPMLAANGIAPQLEPDGRTPKKLAVGPGRVLYAKPDASGKVGSWAYVEPSAQSLTFLAADVKETVQQLRELGRQPLTAQSGNLTTITTAVAAGKSKSAVAAWALNLKNSLENALVITAMWMNLKDYDPEVNVYTDFDDFSENAKDVETLDKARERKDISRETYLSELKRRKILSAEFNAEADMKLLLEETPNEDEGGIEEPPLPLFNRVNTPQQTKQDDEND